MKPSKLVTGFVCAALLFPYVAFAGVALDEEYLNGVAFEGQSAQMMQIAALSDSEMESTEGAGWWWVVPVILSLLLTGDTPQDNDNDNDNDNDSSWSWSRR